MSLQVEGIKDIPNFEMFGISCINDNEALLYPKSYIDSEFSDFKLKRFTSPNNGSSEKGLMIDNSICFNQMIELFKSVDRPLIANVSDSNIQISIIGVLL